MAPSEPFSVGRPAGPRSAVGSGSWAGRRLELVPEVEIRGLNIAGVVREALTRRPEPGMAVYASRWDGPDRPDHGLRRGVMQGSAVIQSLLWRLERTGTAGWSPDHPVLGLSRSDTGV